MKKFKIFAILFLLLCSNTIFAATSIPVYTDAQKNITVTTEQPTFIIKLKSNPGSTGYDWTQPQFDSALLKLVSYKFEPPAYDPSKTMQKIGAPGYGVWTFTLITQPATSPAIVRSTDIRFTYKREWEKEPADIEVFNVTLPIQ